MYQTHIILNASKSLTAFLYVEVVFIFIKYIKW